MQPDSSAFRTAEWVARQTPMSYMFWVFAAMVAAFQSERLARRAGGYAVVRAPLRA